MLKPAPSSSHRRWIFPLCLGLFVASISVSGFSYWKMDQKVDQCEQLIAVINRGHATVLSSKVQDATSSHKFAQELEEITLKLGFIEIKDGQLQEYQIELERIYRELSQAFRQISRVLQLANTSEKTQEGLKQLETARLDIQSVQISVIQTAREADQLVQQVNLYCTR